MARKKQIHAAKHHHLRAVVVSLSPTDEVQIQEQLQNYQEIAQALHSVNTLEQASDAVAPIIVMPESAQLSFARELSKEANVSSADVLNALYTLSPAKEARKEARRSLIRLEANRVYPSWEPPAPPRQLPILEESNVPDADANTFRSFYKGIINGSKEIGELQLTLCWHEGARIRLLAFLLDFWGGGVKDFFTRLESERGIDGYTAMLDKNSPTGGARECTLAEGRQLVLEALEINNKFGIPPHKDYTRNLPLVRRLVLDAEPGAVQETLPVPVKQNASKTARGTMDDPSGLLDALVGKRQRAEINEDGEFDFSDLIADEVAEDFLTCWSEGEFEKAYAMLSDHSPLRENLAQDEWVARRRAWFEQYQPHDLQVDEYSDLERSFNKLQSQPLIQELFGQNKNTPTEESTDKQDEATEQEQITTFWSLALKEIPQGHTLPEFPLATLVNQESGRHWFWTTFRFVEEDDAWHILDMVDEGIRLHALSLQELQQEIENIKARATKLARFMTGPDEAEEEQEAIAEQDEDASFFSDKDPLGMSEAYRLKNEMLYYNDVLLSKGSESYESYISAFEQAVPTRQYERSDAYSLLTIRRFPDRPADILRSQIAVLSTFADTLRNMDEAEEATALSTIVESRLRAIIKLEPERATNYIALLEALERHEKPDREPEMQELVQKAQKLAKEPRELAMVEIGLALLERLHGNDAEALHHYQQATQSDPSYGEAWYALGHLQHDLDRDEEAEQSLLRCLELNPKQTDAYVELIAIYRQRGEYDRAHALLDQGIPLIDTVASKPSDVASIYVAAALLAIAEGDREKAYEQLERAETLAPELQSLQDAQGEFRRVFEPRVVRDEDERERRSHRPKKRKKKR